MKKFNIILGLIGVIGLAFFFGTADHKVDCESLKQNEKSDEYSGVIIEKYIDQDQHMYEKVILDKSPGTDVILLNWETSGFFDFLKIGDSISKNPNGLQVNVWRNDKDTIYNLEFYCLEETYSLKK